MFKLSRTLTFRWPVKVIEPDPDKPGRLIEIEFEAVFAIIDPELARSRTAERNAIMKRMVDGMSLEELRAIEKELDEHDFASVKDVLRGWDKILDENDRPIPFNDDTLKKVYRYPRVKNALVRAYQEAISEDKARLGN